MDALLSDVVLMFLIYILLLVGFFMILKKHSSHAKLEEGDREFREALNAWLSDGYLIESASVRKELQDEFEAYVSLFTARNIILTVFSVWFPPTSEPSAAGWGGALSSSSSALTLLRTISAPRLACLTAMSSAWSCALGRCGH